MRALTRQVSNRSLLAQRLGAIAALPVAPSTTDEVAADLLYAAVTSGVAIGGACAEAAEVEDSCVARVPALM